MNLSPFRDYIKKTLSPERYLHCIGVMNVMAKASTIYGLDKDLAMQAGLLHDIAKELEDKQLLELVKHEDMAILEKLPKNCHIGTYLHGPAGAILVRQI